MIVDFKDQTSVKQFLTKYNKLSETKLAQIAGVSRGTIQYWKRKFGMTNQNNIPEHLPKKAPSVTKPLAPAPSDWDCKEWLEEMYITNGYGTRIIGKLVGKHPNIVYKKLKKYGITTRSIKEATVSKNKYCDYTWLYKHYIEMRWSLAKCAEYADVSPSTIINWLVRFKIPVRDSNGTTRPK